MKEIAASAIYKYFKKEISPNQIDIIFLPGSIEGRTVGCLIFEKEEQDPLIFIKVYREQTLKRLNREKYILRKLESEKDRLQFQAPSYILDGLHNESPYLAQSIVKGNQYHFDFNQRNIYENADLEQKILHVTKALVGLAKIKSEKIKKVSSSEIRKKYNHYQDKRNLVQDFQLNNLENLDLKNSIIHGDFVPHNILLSNSNKYISIIDWTDVDFSGVVFFDLMHFFIHVLMRLRSSTSFEGLTSVLKLGFFEENQVSKIFQSSSKYYADQLGIDYDEIQLYFYYFLMRYALYENKKISKSIQAKSIPTHIFSMNDSNNINNLQLEYWSSFLNYSLKNRSSITI